MTTTNFLSILLASLLLTPQSSPFMLQTTLQTRPVSSSLTAASSDDNNSLTRSDLPTTDLSKNIDEPDKTLPEEPTHNTLHPTPLDNRSSEFHLQPLPTPSPQRIARLEIESRLRSIYTPAGSDAYWALRDEILQLQSDLEMAKSVLRHGDSDGIKAMEVMLRRAQAKDPEHVYRVTTQAARVAGRMGREEEAERYRLESERAKSMLPQFNLEGLWVGKYGSHGFEMINVTYVGDQLIAYKVTGDHNIPRGHISFTADLSPPGYSGTLDKYGPPLLDPIVLSETSAKKWGTKRLPRYPGQGQAAEPGYRNPQYLEGQLVVIGPGDYFSFAWIPLEHQIFFGRPSPELTLKMLREGGSASLTAGTGQAVPSLEEGSLREMTDYVARCLEVTVDTFWEERNEGKVSEWSGIWHGNKEHSYFQ